MVRIGDYIMDLETYQYWKIDFVQYEEDRYTIERFFASNMEGTQRIFTVKEKGKVWTYPIV